MIILNEKWEDTGYGDVETTGRWVYDRFYGPTCDIEVQGYDYNRVGIKIQRVCVEAENSMSDFSLLCLMAKEFLEEYSEVAITIPRLERICKFTRNEEPEETLTKLIKQVSLI